MLLELNIKNFAIIDNLNVSFGKGLNILTGETGAGKSIIIDAVKLLLGDRASIDAIRAGKDEALVEAVFDIKGYGDIKGFLDAAGIPSPIKTFEDMDEENLIIKRLISRAGKNRIFINGSISTIAMLSEIGKNLIDIYGQHEHQSLVNPDIHIDIFDSFAGLMSLRDKTAESFHRFSEKRIEIERLKENAKTIKERQDFLLFQSQEIGTANLKPDEDLNLQKEKEMLVNAEKLFEASNIGYNVIYSQEGSVVESIGQVLNRLKDASKYDGSLAKNVESIESCLYQLEDISASLRDYSQAIIFDPKHLEEIDNRLDLINKLKKKYNGTIQEIIDKKIEIDRELEIITSSDERILELENEVEKLKNETIELAKELSKKRKAKVLTLKKAVEAELSMLNMKKTVFEVRIENLKPEGLSYNKVSQGFSLDDKCDFRLSEKGMDGLEFYISPNIGEEPKPIAKIASGGELSRIMLAIKRVAALAKSVPVLIFDEIDAGIGGGTAEAVGKKLKQVSKEHQVLCITHLPQIAAYADKHFLVSKTVKRILKDSRTIAEIKELNSDEKMMEISRMLGGEKITDKTVEHAKEMLENAKNTG
ncbi:MAG: DNA repair protein RecN [Deltaproteobacteria bacterium]|nr:DNA repair protein RecN [Deltaproteobacteria bacterium]